MVHPTHERQMDLRRIATEMEADSLFADLIPSIPISTSIPDVEVMARATKNHMWLIAGFRSPKFPLRMGQTLYVNVSRKDGPDTMTLKRNATLDTVDGNKVSLDAAERAYHPSTRRQYGHKQDRLDEGKKGKGNAWTQIRVETPYFSQRRSGYRYTSLSVLFVDHRDKLAMPVETLVNDAALATYLLEHGWTTAPHLRMIQLAAAKLVAPVTLSMTGATPIR